MGKGRVTPREIEIIRRGTEARKTARRLAERQTMQPLSPQEEVELIYAMETAEAAHIISMNISESMGKFDFSGDEYN